MTNATTPADTDKQLARKYRKSLLDTITAKFAVCLGLILLGIGGVAIPAVDWSLFYDLYKSDFESDFGELTVANARLVAVFSAQALMTLLAVKFFANTPERRSKLAAAAFAGGMLFAVGAALERADNIIQENAEYSETDIGFSWGAPESTEETATTPAQEPYHISAYLLSLGFVVLPMIAALAISAGWSSFTGGKVQLTMARDFRKTYRKLGFATDRLSALEDQIESLVAQEDAQIRKPLDERITALVEARREDKNAMRTIRQKGMQDVLKPKAAHDPSQRYTDIDGIEADADAVIQKFGNGYCEDMFTRWSGRKPAAP